MFNTKKVVIVVDGTRYELKSLYPDFVEFPEIMLSRTNIQYNGVTFAMGPFLGSARGIHEIPNGNYRNIEIIFIDPVTNEDLETKPAAAVTVNDTSMSFGI